MQTGKVLDKFDTKGYTFVDIDGQIHKVHYTLPLGLIMVGVEYEFTSTIGSDGVGYITSIKRLDVEYPKQRESGFIVFTVKEFKRCSNDFQWLLVTEDGKEFVVGQDEMHLMTVGGVYKVYHNLHRGPTLSQWEVVGGVSPDKVLLDDMPKVNDHPSGAVYPE